MKKFVLFVMLMMCAVSVNAQRWSLTPEVGMTAINRADASLVNKPWDSRWKIGVGVGYDVVPGWFSVKSGLYYTQRGFSYKGLLFGQVSVIEGVSAPENAMFGEYSVKSNRHFLQMPVMANLSIRLADEVSLNLAAGPYIACSMTDRWEVSQMHYRPGETASGGHYGEGWSGVGTGYTSAEMNDHPFDWGVSFQVGIEAKQWVMNAGYELDLGKEFEYDKCGAKYHTLSLSVGYKFKLGK